MVVTAALLWLGFGHRSGPLELARPPRRLGRARLRAARLGRAPLRRRGVSLLIALFGMYWDISLHIDDGRDPGPLANPAHYFILFGLFGIFAAGFAAIALPREQPGPAAIRHRAATGTRRSAAC